MSDKQAQPSRSKEESNPLQGYYAQTRRNVQ
jgi:hypothetical protein